MCVFSVSNIICVKMSHYTNGFGYFQKKTTKVRVVEARLRWGGRCSGARSPWQQFSPKPSKTSHLLMLQQNSACNAQSRAT